jgi:hypothetical protein
MSFETQVTNPRVPLLRANATTPHRHMAPAAVEDGAHLARAAMLSGCSLALRVTLPL